MGLIHAWRMQKLVADARTAYNEGDATFVAVLDIDFRHPGATMKKIRKELDVMIRNVEAVGWQCVGVQPFLSSVEIGFIRR
ncbi:hypothetical protein [Kitasatospora sp. NPDC093806]|uniref:hypothetical protein n=1 Tax=Kitasatospora sp. NPDC093806 TaxID=3155075 RepID=UPI00343FEC59